MIKMINEYRQSKITKDQCKDTGMAMVLIFLIVAVAFKKDIYIYGAIGLHVINMITPQVYRPVAVVWLGLAHILGTIASTVILSVVFMVVVTPIGLLRRMLGKDSLNLKDFKTGRKSVMHERNHTFAAEDITKPY